MRTSFRELGPLRPIVAYMVMAPLAGTVIVLWQLDAIATALLAQTGLSLGLLVVAVTLAVGTALVLPSAAAFAAGYCSGAFAGTGCAVIGIAIGSVLARQLIAPRLGPKLFAFMHNRPRAVAVRRFCRGGLAAATFGVARVRWGAVFPHAAANLLFAVAAVPSVAVFRGSVLGALPASLLAAFGGDCFRAWQATRVVPDSRSWLAAAAVLFAMACLWRASRRLWRAQLATDTASLMGA